MNNSQSNVIQYYVESDDLTPRFKDGDAGIDLRSAEDVTLNPGETKDISTGCCMNTPYGYFGMLVPRSSTGKKGLIFRNTVGIVDYGFHDPIIALAKNNGTDVITIERGERFAQIVFVPHLIVEEMEPTKSFDSINRGGGLGSTGRF